VTNLVQPIIRNTRYGSRKKIGNLFNRVMFHEGIIPMYLSDVVQPFFVFGNFAPVGAFSVNGDGFHIQRGIQPFVRSNSQFSMSGRNSINE
jgi:hypothetical protein